MPSEQAATFKSTWWEILLPNWLPEKFRTSHLGPFLIIVWAIATGLFLLSFLSPNVASQTTLLITACTYLVLSGAAIMGLPAGVAVHLGLVISSLRQDGKTLNLSGFALSNDRVSEFLRQLAQGLSEQSTEVALDASALTRFDSAALAVLLELRRQSLSQGLGFSVLGLPAPLASLAAL